MSGFSREPIFPFTVYCDRRRGWTDPVLRNAFLNIKPKDLIWYGIDTVFLAKNEVEFIVFGMADSVYGYVGAEIDRFRTVFPSAVSSSFVTARIRELATACFEEAERARIENEIRSYEQLIRSEAALEGLL